MPQPKHSRRAYRRLNPLKTELRLERPTLCYSAVRSPHFPNFTGVGNFFCRIQFSSVRSEIPSSVTTSCFVIVFMM